MLELARTSERPSRPFPTGGGVTRQSHRVTVELDPDLSIEKESPTNIMSCQCLVAASERTSAVEEATKQDAGFLSGHWESSTVSPELLWLCDADGSHRSLPLAHRY